MYELTRGSLLMNLWNRLKAILHKVKAAQATKTHSFQLLNDEVPWRWIHPEATAPAIQDQALGTKAQSPASAAVAAAPATAPITVRDTGSVIAQGISRRAVAD